MEPAVLTAPIPLAEVVARAKLVLTPEVKASVPLETKRATELFAGAPTDGSSIGIKKLAHILNGQDTNRVSIDIASSGDV